MSLWYFIKSAPGLSWIVVTGHKVLRIFDGHFTWKLMVLSCSYYVFNLCDGYYFWDLEVFMISKSDKSSQAIICINSEQTSDIPETVSPLLWNDAIGNFC
jgi:hypothetical protein